MDKFLEENRPQQILADRVLSEILPHSTVRRHVIVVTFCARRAATSGGEQGNRIILNNFAFTLFTDTRLLHSHLLSLHSAQLVRVVLVVAWYAVSGVLPIQHSLWPLTQVEVVVLRVADENEATDEVGKR